MNFSKQSNLVLVLVLCIVVGTVANVSWGKSSAAPQDPASLYRRRKVLLEQRFYMLESSVNRLQTYLASQRAHPTPQPSTSDRDVLLIRDEVQRLSLRLSEVECGLLKLDERTATRRSTEKSDDPCRVNVETPLRLSARP